MGILEIWFMLAASVALLMVSTDSVPVSSYDGEDWLSLAVGSIIIPLGVIALLAHYFPQLGIEEGCERVAQWLDRWCD